MVLMILMDENKRKRKTALQQVLDSNKSKVPDPVTVTPPVTPVTSVTPRYVFTPFPERNLDKRSHHWYYSSQNSHRRKTKPT